MPATEDDVSAALSTALHALNKVVSVGEARAAAASCLAFIQLGYKASDELPGSIKASLLDLPMSSDDAVKQLDNLTPPIQGGIDSLRGYKDSEKVPADLWKPLRTNITAGYTLTYEVMGYAAVQASYVSELLKVSDNIASAVHWVGENVVPAIGNVLGDVASAGKWLIVGVVALAVIVVIMRKKVAG